MSLWIHALTVSAMAAATAAGAAGPLGADWRIAGEGQWTRSGHAPEMIRQARTDGATTALAEHLDGAGPVWRCLVEPGPSTPHAGFWFAASPDLGRGWLVTLGGNPGTGGMSLRAADGAVLWQDRFAPWTYYTPYLVEAVAAPGKVRVQLFSWNRETLLAQSDWIDAPGADPAAPDNRLGLYTENGVARFYHWERAAEPLSPIVPDSPTKMRLASDDSGEWIIVGPGDWKWTSPERTAIRQGAKIERSTAINTALAGRDGLWQCRVTVGPDTGGSGMTILTNEALDQGFIVWLGGTFGAGGLMVYRLPHENLWSSPQDKWHYNTEYLLEGCVKDGTVSARLLAADGTTVIAASPEFPLTDEEKARDGFVGFQTWKGTARFWGFSAQTEAQAAPAPEPPAPDAALGAGWRVTGGDWRWADAEHSAVDQTAADGVATALALEARGTRHRFQARVVPGEGAQSVALVFQASPELDQGFVCGLGKGAYLRTLAGRTLWEKADIPWQPGQAYTIEANVITDRVHARILDAAGNVIATSGDCYVSDTNNTREGVLGFRTENGAARFSHWSVTPLE